MAKKPTKKQIVEAAVDVECSALANTLGVGSTLEHYRSTAEMAAVDWLNERGLDNSYADAIVKLVMKGF